MSKGGWIVKFNDVEVERCYAVSFDYDMWEYTVNNQVTKKFPASGISTIKIEGGLICSGRQCIMKRQCPDLTLRLKFLLMIEALFKSKGEDISSITKSDLAKRFNVNKSTIHEAFNDLKK